MAPRIGDIATKADVGRAPLCCFDQLDSYQLALLCDLSLQPPGASMGLEGIACEDLR